MLGQAFVSFAGLDRAMVDRLIEKAPKGLFRIYTHDFLDSASLLAEMERQVKTCEIFVFLASQESLRSVWCRHEIALAQVESITRGIKVFVLTIDGQVSLGDLPPWMRSYWISANASRPSAIGRRFLSTLEDNLLKPVYSGENLRAERAHHTYLQRVSDKRVAPNVMFFSGIDNIGRSVTAKLLINRIHENTRFSNGPSFSLEDPASIEDLCMKLIEEYSGILGDKYTKELALLRDLPESGMVSRAVIFIESICKDDESVFIRCRSGLFDDNGYMLPWAKSLVQECATKSQVRLIIISTRAPRPHEALSLDNMMHYHVNRLDSAEIDALVRKTTLVRTGHAMTPSAQAQMSIGGHPVLARAYSYAVATYGESSEERAVYETILEQKSLLGDFLGYNNLEEQERDVLAILSWVPDISPEMLEELCAAVGIDEYAAPIADLILASLSVRPGTS